MKKNRPSYFSNLGGLPPQGKIEGRQAVFTSAYAFLPGTVMRDIVTSFLPHWQKTRLWVIARPMTGFSETFSHYIMEVEPDGGSNRPDDNKKAQTAIFVVEGELTLLIGREKHVLGEGGFAFIPAGKKWHAENRSKNKTTFHWIRKAWQKVKGIAAPDIIIASDHETMPIAMPDTDGKWATTRFIDPQDLRYDFHINIVTFEPGANIPFMETHVMEHGLYVLEGKADYHLNQDIVKVEVGDYMWLRAFCPQACIAKGKGKFRYLLYKDVNRHAKLPEFT